MVQEGQAVVYHGYLSACPELKDKLLEAQDSARARRLGYWNQPNPLLPEGFRRTGGLRRSVQPTRSSPSPTRPTPTIPPEAIHSLPVRVNLSCGDFATQSQAQAALPTNPQLDGYKDGVACESLR